MAIDTHHGDTVHLCSLLIDIKGSTDVDAKFIFFKAGRDIGVSFCIYIWIDSQ